MAGVAVGVAAEVIDPLVMAQYHSRRRNWDKVVEICDGLLARNATDEVRSLHAVWCLKTRALREKAWTDDTEMEEESLAESMMDNNALASAPRPGTSFTRPATSSRPGTNVRPVTSSGRPVSGYVRPGTASTGSRAGLGPRPTTGAPATSAGRPVTAAGRRVRLGTASLASGGPGAENWIDLASVNTGAYVKRPQAARLLAEYLLTFNAPLKALELAAAATAAAGYKDWAWKAVLGRAYFQLGMLREAERQLRSSLKDQPMITTTLHLAKVYIKLDQPNTALETYQNGLEQHVDSVPLLLGIARVQEALGNSAAAADIHKRVLGLDPSNAESMACLAADHFYSDQPELALRFYRRMLQMQEPSAALWNNIGLSCYYAQQYDIALAAFQKALSSADDDVVSDVWYNVGQVAIGIGDHNLASQAFKIAISANPANAEAHNCLGVLEMKAGRASAAASSFRTAVELNEYNSEPMYNLAALCNQMGDVATAFSMCTKALSVTPDNVDAQDLLKSLRRDLLN